MSGSAQSCDAAIVGGGIVGAACALELAEAGLKVLVIEPACIGAGATAAGMGHVVVMDGSEAELVLTSFAQGLWERLVPSLTPASEYARCGTTWIAADDEEVAEARRKQGRLAARGIASTPWDARELAAHEPALRPGLAGGLHVPGDAVLYPPAAARDLMALATARGAAVVSGTARAVSEGQVALADGTRIACGTVVLACGLETAALRPRLPLRGRKGHLAITERYPGTISSQLLELGYVRSAHSSAGDSVAFNVQPRVTGQLLIGSSRQYDDPRPEVEGGILSRMLRRAEAYLPALGGFAVVRVWTGIRAVTPDHLPLIGPVPGEPGVYVATGFEGLGITMAPAAGRLIADLMLGRPPVVSAEPYLPARFGEGRGGG